MNDGMDPATTTTHPPPPPPQGEPPERVLRIAAINLRRLLHCMQTSDGADDMSWEAVLMRADTAQALWFQVQEGWNAIAQEKNPNDEEAYMKLQQEVDVTCRRAQQIAQDIQRRRKEANETDLIEAIFLQTEEDTDEEESVDAEKQPPQSIKEELREPATSLEHEKRHSPRRRHPSGRHDSSGTMTQGAAKHNMEELQKAQREQLEKEISRMAEQLKYSTEHMHSTLKNQTEDLDEMGEMASENVEKMTKVTDDVTKHVRKQWRNTLATWTMLFTIFGTFFFCFLTIRVVPKRSTACIFFCPKERKSWKEDGRHCVEQKDGGILCEKIATKKEKPPKEEKPPKKEKPQKDVGKCADAGDGECKVSYPRPDVMETEKVKHDTAAKPDDTCVTVDENGSCRVDDDSKAKRAGKKEVTEKPNREREEEKHMPVDFDVRDVRRAAAQNMVEKMREYLRVKPEYAHAPDKNGWQCIHEASRLGHTDMVGLLIREAKVDVNARTGRYGPTGGTPLWWAYKSGLQENHGVVTLLKKSGGVSLGPNE